MFAGKKSAQIREILISESAWEEMTCLFAPSLSMEDVRIIGARYNRGLIPTLEEIKRNTSYGDFIVNHWQRFSRLIWG